jgi:hypothetical protein
MLFLYIFLLWAHIFTRMNILLVGGVVNVILLFSFFLAIYGIVILSHYYRVFTSITYLVLFYKTSKVTSLCRLNLQFYKQLYQITGVCFLEEIRQSLKSFGLNYMEAGNILSRL